MNRIKNLDSKQIANYTSNIIKTNNTGNNSKMRQMLYLLYQHNKIPQQVYNNLIKS